MASDRRRTGISADYPVAAALDQALDALAAVDARLAQVIELRAFAGLDFNEIAEYIGISRATLARDFRAARAWLYKALNMAPPTARES